MISWLLQKLIRLYQLLLSPFWGSQCRFFPTCSNYGIEAIQKYGSVRGSYLTVRRICRCNPWTDGGFDPVP
jgi:putative membrane protein insertion efficiency factor